MGSQGQLLSSHIIVGVYPVKKPSVPCFILQALGRGATVAIGARITAV